MAPDRAQHQQHPGTGLGSGRKEPTKVKQSEQATPPLSPKCATATTKATNVCSNNGVPPSRASTYASKGYVKLQR
eukprot:9337651-Pyramimonas_sp.AAC.1